MSSRSDGGDFLLEDDRVLVDALLGLPHKIIKNQHVDGLAHLVMHEISKPERFGLQKSAFLVDNPDFDCLKGIAGYSHDSHAHLDDVWQNPDSFLNMLGGATFNDHIKGFESQSLKKNNRDMNVPDVAGEISEMIGIRNPSVILWDMKHDNHGLFIFEPPKNACIWRHALLSNVVAFLSLCAI